MEAAQYVTDSTTRSDEVPIRFERILFPTDFSPSSEKALPYVAAFARRFSSELWVAHVISQRDFVDAADQDVGNFAFARCSSETRIDALLASAHLADIPHRVLIEQGGVWAVLSRLTEKINVDLIAAGTHGPHGFEKLVDGSTAEAIERLSIHPVLLVGPAVVADPMTELKIDRILFTTDFRPESRRAIEYAYALATAYAAQLLVLHVIDNPLGEPLAAKMSNEEFCRLRMAQNKWPQPQLGVRPEFIVAFGSPEEQTLQIVANRHVQLLVLSAPGMRRPRLKSRLPGPFAYDLVTHARCAVLTIPEDNLSSTPNDGP